MSPRRLLSSLGRNHHLCNGLWHLFHAGFAAVQLLLYSSDSWCTKTSFEDLIILCHIPWKYCWLTDPLLGSESLLSSLGRNHHPCNALLHLFHAGFAAVSFLLNSTTLDLLNQDLNIWSYSVITFELLVGCPTRFWTQYVLSVHLAATIILFMCCHTSSMRGLRPFLFSCTPAILDALNHQFKIWIHSLPLKVLSFDRSAFGFYRSSQFAWTQPYSLSCATSPLPWGVCGRYCSLAL